MVREDADEPDQVDVDDGGAQSSGGKGKKKASLPLNFAALPQLNGAMKARRSRLEAEIERGPDFLRLANALSTLYPR